MSLQSNVMDAMKSAMKSKDTLALEALRAIKSELLLAQTQSGSKEELTEEEEIKILQKLVKQRKDSANIYQEQGREDLVQPELDQAKVIEAFLPEQLSEEEVRSAIEKIVSEGSFSGMGSMGQVMGLASKALAGKADGKTISSIVKAILSK
ncbi:MULTISPECIES: GatB/YqeY domain-containing protein [Myroides]|uniref:GatB/YqeY domain-containing protein n=1 Tax=Myroides albus TaxID=2562892 RepID=A0A6I3LJR1_9FLAO|nr:MULTISPECIES: GatB/YqeY domain-containing protein [Myroides]MTG98077.1 GatB/YqeY domain-containing protein [Myroides albus]MVX36285.1 GatB/YqeY domain-containing protein [Myroides sp. LoEW2-1]UVD80743.1 GatB/YqeY domain-containing protein [Myroides albus]